MRRRFPMVRVVRGGRALALELAVVQHSRLRARFQLISLLRSCSQQERIYRIAEQIRQ